MMPNAKFLAGYWMLGEDPQKGEDWKTAVGAHFVATSLTDAVAMCVREARAPDRDFCASAKPSGTGDASVEAVEAIL